MASFIVVLIWLQFSITYSQSCITNKLVLDSTLCNIECNECLNYIYINLDHLTINSSSSISSILSPSSECKCPSFTLKLHEDNQFRIFHPSRINFVGAIALDTTTSRIKIEFSNWIDTVLRNTCSVYYVPNTHDLMTVQSYSGTLFIDTCIDTHFSFSHNKKMCIMNKDLHSQSPSTRLQNHYITI